MLQYVGHGFTHGHFLLSECICDDVVEKEIKSIIIFIFAKADMYDVTRQNVTKLRRHVHLDSFALALLDLALPIVECLDQFDFKRLKHVL